MPELPGRQSVGGIEPLMETTYFRGDKAQYTGKTEEAYGRTWYEIILLEGHNKGKLRLVKNPPKGETK